MNGTGTYVTRHRFHIAADITGYRDIPRHGFDFSRHAFRSDIARGGLYLANIAMNFNGDMQAIGPLIRFPINCNVIPMNLYIAAYYMLAIDGDRAAITNATDLCWRINVGS